MEHSKLITSKSFFEVNPIVIGIDSKYSFVMKVANNNILPITEKTVVNLLRLLEVEYNSFYQEIEEMVDRCNTVEGKVAINASSFPYGLIIKTALNSERDYWIELSMPWLKEIGKSHFLEDIAGILKNKNVSQKTRHSFLKL